jgi:hypothetical protein
MSSKSLLWIMVCLFNSRKHKMANETLNFYAKGKVICMFYEPSMKRIRLALCIRSEFLASCVPVDKKIPHDPMHIRNKEDKYLPLHA